MNAVAITIANIPDELARVRAAVDRFAAANQLSLDEAADLHVALDEILTNIIKYGYTDDRPHEICVQLGVERGMLVVTIEDDGRAFDPLMLPEPDVNISLRQRQPGGLGIHFVRKLMTEGAGRHPGRMRRKHAVG